MLIFLKSQLYYGTKRQNNYYWNVFHRYAVFFLKFSKSIHFPLRLPMSRLIANVILLTQPALKYSLNDFLEKFNFCKTLSTA